MIEHYFVYDKMMLPKHFESVLCGHAKIKGTKPAFIKAKMYIADNQPICVRPNQGRKNCPPAITFGVIHNVEIDRMGVELLDRLNCCSRSTMGINYKGDMMHRHHVKAREIVFDDLVAFTKYDYKVVVDHEAWVYLGNDVNSYVSELIWNPVNRCGNIWRDFFNAF